MGICRKSDCGEEKIHFVTYNGTIGQSVIDNQTLISKFGYYILLNNNIHIKICAGSGQPVLIINDLNKIKVIVPRYIRTRKDSRFLN